MADPQNPPPPPDGSAVIAQSSAIPPPPDGSGVVANGASGAAPAADSGTLSKIWDWANKGLISGKTLVNLAGDMLPRDPAMKPGETSADFLDRMQSHIDPDHPYLAALTSGLAGVDKDVAKTISSFSSPLSLALAGTGAATALPGAAGTVAKAITTASGAGIAGKGATDIASAGTENTPEAWQQRLTGGAEMAGGTAAAIPGIKAAAGNALLLGKTPQEAYQSALKPSTTIPPGKVANIVNTGLTNEIPVSKAGIEKLGSLLDDLHDKVTAEIGAGQGKTIDPIAVASRADALKPKFANQVNPTGDLQAIEDSKQEFLKNQEEPPAVGQGPPNMRQIPAADAQAMKTGTYQQLKGKAYGELKSASIEAQKALARGLKEELVNQFPELKDLNAAEGSLYDLQPVLEKAIQRQGNHQIMGIGTPIATGATKAVTGSSGLAAVAGAIKAVIDNPIVKSHLAIALDKAGISPGVAAARIQSYAGGLAASVANSATGDDRNKQPAQ